MALDKDVAAWARISAARKTRHAKPLVVKNGIRCSRCLRTSTMTRSLGGISGSKSAGTEKQLNFVCLPANWWISEDNADFDNGEVEFICPQCMKA